MILTILKKMDNEYLKRNYSVFCILLFLFTTIFKLPTLLFLSYWRKTLRKIDNNLENVSMICVHVLQSTSHFTLWHYKHCYICICDRVMKSMSLLSLLHSDCPKLRIKPSFTEALYNSLKCITTCPLSFITWAQQFCQSDWLKIQVKHCLILSSVPIYIT